jgi:hypothetical protein
LLETIRVLIAGFGRNILNVVRIIEGQMKICKWLYNQLVQKANELRDRYVQAQDAEAGKTLYGTRGLRNY